MAKMPDAIALRLNMPLQVCLKMTEKTCERCHFRWCDLRIHKTKRGKQKLAQYRNGSRKKKQCPNSPPEPELPRSAGIVDWCQAAFSLSCQKESNIIIVLPKVSAWKKQTRAVLHASRQIGSGVHVLTIVITDFLSSLFFLSFFSAHCF